MIIVFQTKAALFTSPERGPFWTSLHSKYIKTSNDSLAAIDHICPYYPYFQLARAFANKKTSHDETQAYIIKESQRAGSDENLGTKMWVE